MLSSAAVVIGALRDNVAETGNYHEVHRVYLVYLSLYHDLSCAMSVNFDSVFGQV